jgi:hypothetical protein
LPVEVKVQERVELPEPVTLVGERLQDEVVFVTRLTTLANPFTAPTVTVDVPAVLTIRLALDGLAAIVKSWMLNVTVRVWVRDPLVPVTMTWIVPVDG